MIWLKAIWVNIKSMLEDLLVAAVICALMLGVAFLVGLVIFGVGSVINHFFGTEGVLFVVGAICVAFAAILVIQWIRCMYLAVKNTKERLERNAIELD